MTHPPVRPALSTVRRAIPFLSALALAFALTACGDSTGPGFGTRISITVDSINGPIIFEDAPGEPQIRCAVTFRAAASGGGAATWHGAMFKFFAGPDRATPIDSALFSASAIQDSWGGPTLRDGQSVESQWIFEAGAPFVVTADYRYAPGNGLNVTAAHVRFACGPEPSATAAPPTITELSLTVPPDGLEPSDTLVVSYTATAPLGAWATAIELSGACEKFVEFGARLETTLSHTRRVQVPSDCVLNTPLTVTVYTADAALRLASRPHPGPILVDHTPPTLQIGLIPPHGIHNDLGMIYFVGDSIDMWVWPSDNHRVRSIVYEVLPLGYRDSIPAPAQRLRVPLRPDMTGPIQLRLYARDEKGLTSAPYTTRQDTIKVYGSVERPTVQTSFDDYVADIAIDAEREAIYVSLNNTRQIRVLSATTLETMRTISLPSASPSFDFTPSGDSLIVVHYSGALGVIDLRQATPVLSEIPLTLDASLSQKPTRVVVLDNGKAFVALGGSAPQANVLLEVNLATGEQRVRTDAADANGIAHAHSMRRSPDRLAVVFNGGPGHFRRYDATTDQFTLGGSTMPYGGGLSLDRRAQHTSLGLNIYDASLTFARRVQSIYGSGPLSPGTSLSVDGEYLYIGGRPGVMRSRVSDGQIVDRTRNPILGHIFREASDGSFLVTATDIGTTQLSLIRMR
jgi:hypothetical protein